ncbi:Condensin complex subunit 2 [Novymonas esmeraldas]|uniref:Condensin complex subunit 2 n=1 Tax=Novymonas esmeraldas TaxID=1808958 RepID=A0AAW0F8R7_9TRYP
MHTPEPRPRNSGGGGAPSTTPRAESNNVTPTPRPMLLRRGGGEDTGDTGALHGTIAVGPSLVFDEESGTAMPLDASPQPSQLTQLRHTQQQQQQQQRLPGAARLPRQRPRFHTVQDLDVALHQAIEGKITSRNAWASKEASDLLEGITHTIEKTLDAAAEDDYAGFAKAATVVEGCSKVWTSRVDSTYQQSNQMVQRLLRKDSAPGRQLGGDDDDDGDAGDGTGDEGQQQQQQQQQQRAKSRARSATGAVAATRTLAMGAAEINLDSKSRLALTQTGINAQFRAITSRFDQGNAQGLLMHNAPLGRAGNLVLDVDYSLMSSAAAVAGGGSRRGSGRVSGTTAPPPLTAAARVSQHAAVELDAAVYDSVADLPSYRGVAVALSSAGSSHSPGGLEPPASTPERVGSVGGDAHAHPAGVMDPLLLLPHTAPPPQDRHDLARASFKAETRGGSGVVSEDGRDGRAAPRGVDDAADAAVADWEGGDDAAAEDAGEDWQGAIDANEDLDDDGGDGDDVSDRGAEARRLVSGVAEMERMDTLFHGHTQLALEAEDPASWCPLSDVSANPLKGVQGLSELSRLHREHRFTQSQRGGGTGAGDTQRRTDSGGCAEAPSSPVAAARRARKERTVVFQLPGSPTCPGAVATAPTFSTSATALPDDGALRQAATAARNITPLGKQLLLAKDAGRAVQTYTQSAVQRSAAEAAGLVLPAPPLPGRTIPSYMPVPVHTRHFFQFFTTPLTHWNLLRKSATGRLIDGDAAAADASHGMAMSTLSTLGGPTGGLASRRTSGGGDGADDEDGGGGVDAVMPVEFIPGGAEVEARDGGEAGGDYADYADLYGPDDGHDDDDDDRRYVQEGFRSSAEARLLAQMDVSAAAATAAAATGSGHLSPRSSSSSGGGALVSDPLELLKVLHSPEATIPNQVDVVRLRQLMWEALQGHLEAHQQDKVADLAVLRSAGAAEEAGAAPVQSGTKQVVRAHAQAVLSRLRKRARAAEDDDDDDGEEQPRRPPQPVPGVADSAGAEARLAAVPDAAAATEAAAAAKVALTRFSDVVRPVLPHVATVSTTRTLSPAFFFFSILFLANEHNVVLQSVEGLDDLAVCGIARRVGET